MSDFPLKLKLKRQVKSRMGLAFTKGQVVSVRHSPEQKMNGHVVCSEGWSAMHPLYSGGPTPSVTIFIPLAWGEVVA